MKSLQNIAINPANAIIVIVDAQNGFCREGGSRYSETSARIVPGFISAVQGLTRRMRSARIPIIYIKTEHKPEQPRFAVFGEEPFLKPGAREGEIIDELKPQKGDIVVKKFCHDPFYKTKLDQVLRRLVPDPSSHYAIMTGGAINVCLYHTILGFYLRSFWTVVPVDGVFYSKDNGKELALDMLSWRGYQNVFLSRTNLIQMSDVPQAARPTLVPGT